MEKIINGVNMGLHGGLNKRLHFLDRIPIRYKLAIASVFVVLLPMTLAGVYFYWNISSLITNNATNDLNQLINQVDENIQNSMETIDATSFSVLSNPTIRSFTIDGTGIDINYDTFLLNKSQIESELGDSLLFNDAWNARLITTMYLFYNENYYYSISQSLANNNVLDVNNVRIFKQTQGIHERTLLIIPPSLQNETLYFVRDFYNLNNPSEYVKMVTGTDEVEIYKKYEKVLEYPGAIAFIMDSNGVIYSHPQKKLLGTSVESAILALVNYNGISEVSMGGQTYYLIFKKIGDTDLIFVAGLPKAQVLSTLSANIRNSILIMLLIFLICLAISITLSLKLTGFIKDLLTNINKVKSGDYSAKLPEYGEVDLDLLSTTFNNMTSEIKRLINQVYEEQLLLKETEIKSLQSQMNPHFLFNVLATISWKARMSNDETVYKMVTSLSKLLRASIYSGQESKIPIRQELEFIEFYLYLQKIRFEDKFDYKINTSQENLLDLYIPKLSIEPIVENGVIHGVEKQIGRGSVILNLYQAGESIVFEIIDNGCGFDKNPDEILNQDQVTDSASNHNNIGLWNTNRRLKLIYGDQYGINIKSEANKGSTVTVTIPVDYGKNANV